MSGSAVCASRTRAACLAIPTPTSSLHALVDAILGALADGDIGAHFPPTDPQWRGASSDRFLAFAAERVRQRGGRIAHLDITIVCEAPRIGRHRDAMRARIAAVAGIALDRVAVKATTNEKLGFIGRRRGHCRACDGDSAAAARDAVSEPEACSRPRSSNRPRACSTACRTIGLQGRHRGILHRRAASPPP